MRELFVNKTGISYGLSTAGGKIAGTWAADLLTEGSLAVFESDGTLIDDVAPVVTTPSVYFAKGLVGNGTQMGALVNRKTLKYNKYLYTAPVAKVVSYGSPVSNLVFPTIVAGQIYGFCIVDGTQPFEKTSRTQEYTYTAVTGDTATTILAKVAALIQGVSTIVTVVATAGTQITFTGITAGTEFTVTPLFDMATLVTGLMIEAASTTSPSPSAILNGTYYDASTTPTLVSVYGAATVAAAVATQVVVAEGDATSLTVTETDFSTEKGNINALWMMQPLWTKPSDIVPSQTYTCYVLTWTNENQSGSVPTRDVDFEQLMILAVPSGYAAMILSLDTILAAL